MKFPLALTAAAVMVAMCLLAIMPAVAQASTSTVKNPYYVSEEDRMDYKLTLVAGLVQADSQLLGDRISQEVEGGYLIAEYENKTAGNRIAVINLTNINLDGFGNVTVSGDDWGWAENQAHEHFNKG